MIPMWMLVLGSALLILTMASWVMKWKIKSVFDEAIVVLIGLGLYLETSWKVFGIIVMCMSSIILIANITKLRRSRTT
ncbi:MAG: hypothetical protein ABIJ21_05150 [Nanoarchaeota archaeon]